MRSKQAIGEEQSQRLLIIESAIELFALKGADKVTMRELTSHAKVNLGAVNYYFGSKEALAETVFMELAKRVNGDRVKNLKQVLVQAASEARVPNVDDIVDTFVEPYVASEANAQAGQLLAQLILQHRLSPTPMTQRIIQKHFDPMAKKYVEALALARPGVDIRQFFWGYIFMVSTVVLTVSDRSPSNRLSRLSGGLADTNQRDELKQALLRFIVGGLKATGD
ncbi:MAG: TetR/AcrR family transcriptional regulator [Pseudomonadota bacterium]